MHELAKVTRIQSVSPIEGKDRIELAKVENYDTVVSKGDFKPGDRCVYIFYDSILPERPEFEFLRKRCWSEKLKGFRIRPMKLGGTVSEGLVMPMSILPEGEYKDGQTVTDILGIRLYEPPEEPVSYMAGKMPARERLRSFLLKHRVTRKLAAHIPRIPTDFPSFIPKTDEENIEALWGGLEENMGALYGHGSWYLTEKVEGQSATFVFRKRRLEVYSHTRRVFDGSWMKFACDNRLEAKMRSFCLKTGRKGLVIQGELCGPGIQKNIYKFDSLRLFVFGMMELDGKRLDFHDMAAYCAAMKLETVPLLDEHAELSSELAMVLKNAEGQSVLAPVPREGVVWRSESSGKHFKAKSRSYKVWFDGK